MNFDINIYDELKYNNNENNENYDLKSEYNINIKRNIDSNLSVNALYKILIKNPLLVNMIDEKKETFLSYE